MQTAVATHHARRKRRSDFGDGTTVEGKTSRTRLPPKPMVNLMRNLTVTDDSGYRYSTRQHVVVTPAMLPAADVDVTP